MKEGENVIPKIQIYATPKLILGPTNSLKGYSEDSFGLKITYPYIVGYVSDGAPSGSAKGFSSRLFSKIVGVTFLYDLFEILKNSSIDLNGESVIANQLKEALISQLKEYIEDIEEGYQLDWQTSITVFTYNIETRDIIIYQKGNTICIISSNKGIEFIPSTDPLIMVLTEDKNILFPMNKNKQHIFKFKNVDKIIVASDGIVKNVGLRKMKKITSYDKLKRLIFEDIAKNTKEYTNTFDDKTLMILEN